MPISTDTNGQEIPAENGPRAALKMNCYPTTLRGTSSFAVSGNWQRPRESGLRPAHREGTGGMENPPSPTRVSNDDRLKRLAFGNASSPACGPVVVVRKRKPQNHRTALPSTDASTRTTPYCGHAPSAPRTQAVHTTTTVKIDGEVRRPPRYELFRAPMAAAGQSCKSDQG